MKKLYCLIAGIVLASYSFAEQAPEGESRQYTFAWDFLPDGQMAPRGGTTRGPSVTLNRKPNAEYLQMIDTSLADKERDRRAILAMAGPYRTSFDFLETVGFTEGYEPARPYQSWGTEFVYVVQQSEDFISLQHILVMLMYMPDGSVSDPIVVKHWRQDWAFEVRELTKFIGHRKWQKDRLSRRESQGRWLQSVYQVDDSPRYQALGAWTHYDNYSSWHSDETWRPLPRREFSVRDDYDVLVGTNKHTINPTGWVQEEENLKIDLDENGQKRVLAKEVGLARYERIEDWDWSAGDKYWQETGPFWTVVREAWKDILAEGSHLHIKEKAENQNLFSVMFKLAKETVGENPSIMRAKVDLALDPFVAES